MGELAPRAKEHAWHAARGSIGLPGVSSDENLTLVMLIRDRWYPDQLSHHSGLDSELRGFLSPNLYHLGMVEMKGQVLLIQSFSISMTGQELDNWEETQ